jgi:hypothetical protein
MHFIQDMFNILGRQLPVKVIAFIITGYITIPAAEVALESKLKLADTGFSPP